MSLRSSLAAVAALAVLVAACSSGDTESPSSSSLGTTSAASGGGATSASSSGTGGAGGAPATSTSSTSTSIASGASSTSASASGSTGASSSTSAASSSSGGGDAGAGGTYSIVTVSDYQLIVQARKPDGTLAPGVPWDMKGIAWSPYGVGESQGGSGSVFSTHASQDIPLMKAANINTVRTYGAFERNAAGLAVLDALHAQGMMVAMTVFAAYDDTGYTDAVNAFKDHPAVLLWMVGNEWNYNTLYSSHTLAECQTRVNTVVSAIKALDPHHPVATGYGELPSAADYAKVMAPDVWALNIYPYLDFGMRFTQWKALSTKPFFVSEYGADAYNAKTMAEDQASQATALQMLTAQIRGNLSATSPTKPCVGGAPFEWNDEWWKNGAPSVHDTTNTTSQGVYPDGISNEEWWGIVTAQRTPRTAYTTLQAAYQ